MCQAYYLSPSSGSNHTAKSNLSADSFPASTSLPFVHCARTSLYWLRRKWMRNEVWPKGSTSSHDATFFHHNSVEHPLHRATSVNGDDCWKFFSLISCCDFAKVKTSLLPPPPERCEVLGWLCLFFVYMSVCLLAEFSCRFAEVLH